MCFPVTIGGRGIRISFTIGTGSNRASGSVSNSWESYTNKAQEGLSNQVNLADTVGNTWQITGIQLEVGEQATPFEHRSYGDELRRCQRYFQKLDLSSNSMVMRGATGTTYSNASLQSTFSLIKEMRSTPTMLNVDGGQTVTGQGINSTFGGIGYYELEVTPLSSQFFNYTYDQSNGNSGSLPTSVSFFMVQDNCTTDAEL